MEHSQPDKHGVAYIDFAPGVNPRTSKILDDRHIVLDFNEDRLVGIEFLSQSVMPPVEELESPTHLECDAARWIALARPLLSVLLRQKTTVGNEQLMRELIDTPWPDNRDWDEMIANIMCGRCGRSHPEAEWATFSTNNGPDGFPDHYKV